MSNDLSRGYEALADEFIRVRSKSGADLIRQWASSFAPGSAVLDVACGHGRPLTEVLVEAGLQVAALDAAPSMVAAFERNFPEVPVVCEAAETSAFFGRRFDGVLAVGLVFLLSAEEQPRLIANLVNALRPGGRLLFSAPTEVGAWDDLLTGLPSQSLGEEVYRRLLQGAGFGEVRSHRDKGGNHYYEAVRSV